MFKVFGQIGTKCKYENSKCQHAQSAGNRRAQAGTRTKIDCWSRANGEHNPASNEPLPIQLRAALRKLVIGWCENPFSHLPLRESLPAAARVTQTVGTGNGTPFCKGNASLISWGCSANYDPPVSPPLQGDS